MTEFKKREDSVEVPKNTGTQGFLRTIENIIGLSRVQQIVIDAKGLVSWTRYVREDEDESGLRVDFGDLAPWAIVRNRSVEELLIQNADAALTLAMMLDTAASDGLYPSAFVSGANTIFWKWFSQTTHYQPRANGRLMGLPFHLDRGCPDTALILCAAYESSVQLSDTERAYKIEMNLLTPDTDVEVLPNE
jgi:hypothetical protein